MKKLTCFKSVLIVFVGIVIGSGVYYGMIDNASNTADLDTMSVSSEDRKSIGIIALRAVETYFGGPTKLPQEYIDTNKTITPDVEDALKKSAYDELCTIFSDKNGLLTEKAQLVNNLLEFQSSCSFRALGGGITSTDNETIEIHDNCAIYEADIGTWSSYRDTEGNTFKPSGKTHFRITLEKTDNSWKVVKVYGKPLPGYEP